MAQPTLPFPLPKRPLQSVADLPFPKVASGKVREVFDMGDAFLMVATDRVSAFDVILKEGLAGKGVLLTQLSLFWFERAAELGPHHLVEAHTERLEALGRRFPELRYRSMIVRKLKPLPLEAVVRGYLSGSGWKSYRDSGCLFEHTLPSGLRESEALPEPVLTPTTKAATGHDLPMSASEAVERLGAARFEAVRDRSLELYRMGAAAADAAGLILADTKFEFGTDERGELFLIDEVLTPDSSRYWPRSAYAPGRPQPSFDKQFVRDYLEGLDWDKSPPPPPLPEAVLNGTLNRYIQAYAALTGIGSATGQ